MNVAWSLGSFSTTPSAKTVPSLRSPLTLVPPRPGSTSPRRDKKLQFNQRKAGSPNTKSNEVLATYATHVSTGCDCHDKSSSYNYLDTYETRRSALTPQPANQRKKFTPPGGHHHRSSLTVEDTNLTKSPSAPNLHAASVTSKLALQGSLAGFTAMAAGNMVRANKQTTSQQRPHSTHIRSPRHAESEKESKTSPNTGSSRIRSPCSCQRSPLLPRRLKAHVQTTEVPSPTRVNEITWKERSHQQEDIQKSGDDIQHSPTADQGISHHTRNLVFKETSV